MGLQRGVLICFGEIVMLGAVALSQLARPGCHESCGNISIPYPFGTTDRCAKSPHFLITCNESVHPPEALLSSSIQIIDDISLLRGEMIVGALVGWRCYYSDTGEKIDNDWSFPSFKLYSPLLAFSSSRNKFIAVGCDTSAYINGFQKDQYLSGCISLCSSNRTITDGSCSGIGCCEVAIPPGLRLYDLSIGSFRNHSTVWQFNPCSFAFVTEESSFRFSQSQFQDLQKRRTVPMVLDWVIDNKTCEEAKKNLTSFACQSNSECYNASDGLGYRCNCSAGYQGNPYLPGGCTDINECESRDRNDCKGICINTIGGYKCSCPKGFEVAGSHGEDCRRLPLHKNISRLTFIILTAGITGFFVIVLVAIFSTTSEIKRRQKMKQKRSFFEQNGGILLKQLLASSGDAGDQKALIFTEEELIKATNDFSTSNVIGQGGYGTVLKGTLANKQLVAIKRSKVIDQGQIEQFVNEVNLLSQINHPNVVKLLGCCLETPIPLLVYEFITNKTLFHHLHDANLASSLPWETRLKIATETASALAHMHSNNKIIHRDIKSANILLTNEYNAKVSDFGISRFVPPDKTHLSTLVQGTFGYIDPEYFHSGTLTDKSDVYSFGVLLVELLTGKDVLSLDREEKNRSLAMYFLSSVENDCFQHILEHRVKIEGDVHQLRGVAELAKNCLKITGMKRPTMEEVKQELEALGKQRHSVIKFEENSEEIQPLLNESSDFYGGNSSTTWFGTQGNQVAFDIEGGR